MLCAEVEWAGQTGRQLQRFTRAAQATGAHLLRYGCLYIEVQEAVLPGAAILVHICRAGQGRAEQRSHVFV